MHDYYLCGRCFLSAAEINRGETERFYLCRNKGGLFRVGGLPPTNCVFLALWLPVNWPCGLSPASQAAHRKVAGVLGEHGSYSAAFCMRRDKFL